jgi:hypothetical protein
MSNSDDKSKEQRSALARVVQHNLDRLRNDKTKFRFKRGDRSRLETALFVTELYHLALSNGHKRTDICDKIGKHVFGRHSRDFRIDKWTLPKKVTVIDAKTVDAYRDNPEPQLKKYVYLAMTEVLAELAEEDIETKLIEFHEWAQLQSDTQKNQIETEPSGRLADLLRSFASSFARKLDLPELWSRAERLNAGWDPMAGPQAISLQREIGPAFRQDKLLQFDQWMDRSLPPYPSVQIGSMPFAYLEVELLIAKEVTEGDERVNLRADPDKLCFRAPCHVTAFWDIWFAVAPISRTQCDGVFIRTSSLQFRALDGSFEARGHSADDLQGLTPRDGIVHIDLDVMRQVCLPEDVEDSWPPNNSAKWDSFYRHTFDVAAKLDEIPPSADIPSARFWRVTPQKVQQLLADDHDWWAGGHCEDAPLALPEMPWNFEQDIPALWFQDRSWAANVEFALHSGFIENSMSHWAEAYRDSLSEMEKQWGADAEAADNRLRQSWRVDEDVIVEKGFDQ